MSSLYDAHYGDMIRGLLGEHHGPSFTYYYDLPFEETVASILTEALPARVHPGDDPELADQSVLHATNVPVSARRAEQ